MEIALKEILLARLYNSLMPTCAFLMWEAWVVLPVKELEARCVGC